MEQNKIQSLILDTIKSCGKKRIRRRQLYNLIGVKSLDYEEFKGILTDMEKSGAVVRLKGRRFALPEASGVITGIFTLSRNGGGNIKIPNGDSIYVRPRNTEGALTGDTVQARMSKRRRPGFSPTAKVITVLERSTRPVVGIFRKAGETMYVIPRDKNLAVNLLVKKGEDHDACDGELVVVRVEMPSTGFSHPMCTVTEVLGDPDAPGVDVLAIAKRYQLPLIFPEEVLSAAESIPADLTPEIIENRKDIRSLVTFTIDPVDAKDFDDAISVTKTGDGNYHLGIHIADVSHYVEDESPLDREAINRGMSCYLVDRVIPMLPERLSNELCSLRPNEDRLTKSVFAVIDPVGRIISHDIANTVIRSRMRLTYQQVQAYLDGRSGDGAGDITPDVGDALVILSELTDILVAQRDERGALDFESPEARVVLDVTGRPVDIVKRDRLKAHRMVEEAMILANTITAKALGSAHVPFLYRIHEKPDNEKLEALAETAKALGYNFKISRAKDQTYLQEFLKSLKGNKHERTLNMLLLRSMKRACYSPENRGHYGLALPVYAHFTSPIRRYPDLIVHRKLDAFILGENGKKEKQNMSYFKALGESITQREIITDSAERDSVKMKTAEFMKKHLGDEFDGTITGVIPVGFFVGLDRYFAEGLVHVTTLHSDYYKLDKAGVALVGKSTGHKFMLGDRVRVVVASADKDRGEVDFVLVQTLKKGKR